VCARVDNQRSHGIVIARLRSSVQSLLHQCRDLHQSTYLYLTEDREPTTHHPIFAQANQNMATMAALLDTLLAPSTNGVGR
jgi:hypothetical protein